MRKLTLKKDTVAELTADDLATVVAGYSEIKFACISGIVACVSHRCVTDENCLSVVHGAC